MKKIYVKVFRDFLIILFIVFALDIVFGKLCSIALHNSPDGRYYKTLYVFEHYNEDILMIGSSKAEVNFVPNVFEEELNLTCWNAGRGGQSLPYSRCIQEVSLSRHAPKILILGVNKLVLERPLNFVRMGFLKPFYWDFPPIRPFINEISTNEKYYMFSNLYAYNSTFYYLFRSYFVKGMDGENKHKGWKPKTGHMSIDLNSNYKHEIFVEPKPINKRALKEFETIIQSFKKAGTEIYVVISPDFKPANPTTTIVKLKELANEYHFELLDYSHDTTFIYKPQLFRDFGHLNTNGAYQLSNKIADKIKNYRHSKTEQKPN